MLKNFRKLIGGGSTDRSTSSSTNNVHGSPPNSNNNYNTNTLSKRESKAVQQAAAVAAAAAAVNAHTISNSCTSASNLENGSGSFESNGQHGHNQNSHFQQQQQQYYHLNATRSLSPPPSQTIQKNSYSMSQQQQQQTQLPPPPPLPPGHNNNQQSLQNSSSSSMSNSNLKQLQYQQQQHNNVAAAAAAATAAAEFYEQQMKVHQHKNMELEQQFRSHLDQLKELKDTVNNLNEMNRKLYDENQQFKERNIEQRQQIEHYHVLFQENQQKAEQSLNQIRKERDEAYQNENDIKRRMQLTIDTKQHENLLAINNWKEKFENLKENEIHMSQELNTTKTQLQQEKNKVELLERKCKLLEKDYSILKENWNNEKSSLDGKINDYGSQLDITKKQFAAEKQKMDEKYARDKDDLIVQLRDLEKKTEEVINEKAQINFKYSQLIDSNRDLKSFYQNRESEHEKEIEELKSRVEFYVKKCNDLEKDITDIQESHVRETEEWKKFQADLQTAVRVANDFMTEAEEKMNKMKDDYTLTKEKECQMVEEIEKLKKKLGNQECTKLQSTFSYSKKNKENEDTPYYNPSTHRNMPDVNETPNIVLTPLQLNNPDSSSFSKIGLNYRHNSSGQLGMSGNQTDTDDAKIFSSRSANQTQVILSTPYISKKDFLTDNDIMKKPTNPVKATSSSSLMDSANALHNANMCLTNSDALANLVKQYGVSKRNALIKWCQERLSAYADIEIKNFSSSWNDGLAFCALLHSFMPTKIEYESLKNENNPRKNFQTAFKAAQCVGIEQTLNINELLNNERPDWNAVMNYVALIYKHFQAPKVDDSETTPILNLNFKSQNILSQSAGATLIQAKNGRSSSSSPTGLRNLASSVQNTIPLSLSASTTSTTSNASSFSTSSSSSSISKTIN